MLKKIVLVFAAVALAKAQIPSLGWCPEYVPMANFDMTKFMGIWYEAERYFQISELVSRCVTANYTRGIDGKFRVSNEVVNRFTGVKRVLEGEIKAAASKSEEGKLHIKYTTVPLAPETQYSVLETDYKNFAVLWACTGIGPVHAQNAWVMTRQRVPSGETLQLAYGVLDKYKIWKVPFVKTDQNECAQASESQAPAAAAVAPAPAPIPAAAPVAAPAPVAEAAAPIKEPLVPEPAVAARETAGEIHLRSSPISQEAEAVDETRAEEVAIELADAPVKPTPEASEPVDQLRVTNAEPAAVVLPEKKPVVDEIKAQEVEFKPIAPETIPEVILKVAESAKEAAAEPSPAVAEEPQLSAEPIPEASQTVEVAVPAEPQIKLVEDVQSPAVDPPKIVQAEEPPADEVKPDDTPIEAPKPSEGAVKLTEEPRPAEVLLATEPAQEPKPLEPLPILRSQIVAEVEEPSEVAEKIESPAPVVLLKSTEAIVSDGALEEIRVVEVPAAVESPADSVLVKTLAEPRPEQSEMVILESAEPAMLQEGGEQLLKEAMLVALPETILEPVVPEAPEAPVAAAQPLKAAEVAPEESKVETIAEVPKTLEAEP